MKTLTIGGLFSGIGAHASACERLASDEIKFKVAFQCEFDEKTAKAYDMIHGQTPNLGDITKVRDLNAYPVDILFHTPPCQDISQANRQRAGCEEVLDDSDRRQVWIDIMACVNAIKAVMALMGD